jgi:CheY-like chemotaxis protein
MALACSTFTMKTIEEFDMKSTCDFLLTEPEALFQILAGHEANGEELPLPAIICVCTDTTEKTQTEARIRNDFPSLHGIIEVMAQPCGPRKLAASFLEGQTRASRRAENLHTPSPPPDNPSPNPQVLVQRSTSDFVRGNNANSQSIPPPSFARPPSPLISAAMPTTSAPLASLNQSNPDTPASETTNEYFGSRVLLVDDNAINLRLLVVFAQRQKLRYETATDGLQALNTFKGEAVASGSPARPFDFVLMDLQMPVMGGLESTRKIREFEAEHGLKKSTIVALTGLASERDQQDAVDAGVDMYLVKPVKFADVKRVFGAR